MPPPHRCCHTQGPVHHSPEAHATGQRPPCLHAHRPGALRPHPAPPRSERVAFGKAKLEFAAVPARLPRRSPHCWLGAGPSAFVGTRAPTPKATSGEWEMDTVPERDLSPWCPVSSHSAGLGALAD